MSNDKLVPFTFRFGGGTRMIPESVANNFYKMYAQHDLENSPGYVKPELTEEQKIRERLAAAFVDDMRMVAIDRHTNQAYEYYSGYRDLDSTISLKPTTYTTFIRWTTGMDF